MFCQFPSGVRARDRRPGVLHVPLRPDSTRIRRPPTCAGDRGFIAPAPPGVEGRGEGDARARELRRRLDAGEEKAEVEEVFSPQRVSYELKTL